MNSTRNDYPNITPVLSQETYDFIEDYLNMLKKSDINALRIQRKMGSRLYEVLKDSNINELSVTEFVDALLKTTRPLLFAEKLEHAKGDGSDWTQQEISLLGRIGRVVRDVTVYSSRSYNPRADDIFVIQPTSTLLFVNGALLVGCKADFDRVVTNEHVDKIKFEKFLEENLLPSLLFANADAGKDGAVVTLPVMGGGEFAGGKNAALSREINACYQEVVSRLLEKHKKDLVNVKAVVITGINDSKKIPKNGGPVVYTTTDSIGLAPGTKYKELEKLKVYTGIAGDHLSFPGNDGYVGSPSTHEGGCCTRTNVYTKITGEDGVYDNKIMVYKPGSEKYKKWINVCDDNKITLNFSEMCVFGGGMGNIYKFNPDNNYQPCYLDATEVASYHEKKSHGKTEKMAVRDDNNQLRVRATLANVIKHTLDLDEKIEIKIGNFDSAGIIAIEIDDQGSMRRIPMDSQTWLKVFESFAAPVNNSFTDENDNQGLFEHVIVIAAEEMVGKKIGYSEEKIKPYFAENGDFIYTPKHRASIVGINDFVKNTKVNEKDPIICKLQDMQNQKQNAFYNALLKEMKFYIEHETWHYQGAMHMFYESIYTVCIADKLGDAKNLPDCVKLHFVELNNDSNQKPRIRFEKMKQEAINASKETGKEEKRGRSTKEYYALFNTPNDSAILAILKEKNGEFRAKKSQQKQPSINMNNSG